MTATHRRDALKAMTVMGAAFAAPVAAEAAPKRRPSVRITAADGTHLRHQDWGEGRPVVFLAGWALPLEAWDLQRAALAARGLRCIAYDRRGHGRSDAPSGGYDYDTLADDLAAVLDQLDLRDVVLVGHSMAGGEIVRYFSRHGGARVSKVMFLAPMNPCPAKRPDNPDGFPAEAFEQFRQAYFLTDFPKWLDDNTAPFVTPQTSPGMIAWVKGLMLTTSLQAVVACNRTATEADLRAEIPNIKAPILIVQGDKDASTPLEVSGRRYAALNPAARLVVYEGAPHGLMFTHTRRLNADIAAFAKV